KTITNMLHYRYLECDLTTKRSNIKLERLAFNATAIWHVVDVDPGEIRLSGHRAEAGEIVRLEMSMIITSRWIWKRFQSRFRWCGGQFCFASTEQSQRRGLGFRALHRLNVPRSTANLQL